MLSRVDSLGAQSGRQATQDQSLFTYDPAVLSLRVLVHDDPESRLPMASSKCGRMSQQRGSGATAPDTVSAPTNPDWEFLISPDQIQHQRQNLNVRKKLESPN